MIDNTTRKIIKKNISDLNDELESLKKYKSLFESAPQYSNTQLRYTEEDKIISALKKFVNIYHSKLVTSTEIQELGIWVLDDKSFFDSFEVNDVFKKSLALCDTLIVETFKEIHEKNILLENTSNEDIQAEKSSDIKQIKAYMEKENIDWEDYWFSEYKKRTPEEIIKVEEKIKAQLLKEAVLFLQRNPDNDKTAEKLAIERWVKEYNLFDWQREEREEEYHESNISLLFTKVFNELLEHSELLIKSSDEKAEVRRKCNEQFFDRLKDQVSDKLDGVPALSIPYDNIEGMKRLVRKLILDFEPRLAPKIDMNELKSDVEDQINDETFDKYFAELPHFIKNYIGYRIDGEIKIKRSFVTVEEKVEFINRDAKRIQKGIHNEIALKYLEAERKRLNFTYPIEKELAKLVGEFLFAIDDRFPIQEFESNTGKVKEKIKHGQLIKICAKIYEDLLLNGKIDIKIEEYKSNKAISDIVVPKIEEEYIITKEQKETTHTYFRKRIIEAKKTKDGIKVIINKTS